MIVNKNGLGYSNDELSLKSGSATAVVKDTIVLSKNEDRYITYPVTIDGYVNTLSIGVEIWVNSYRSDGNLLLIPNNHKELVSNTSSVEQVWTIPDGSPRGGSVQVTMNFIPATSSVIFRFETWNLTDSGVKTQITVENAVVYYQYESYENIVEVNENSVKLYKDTTAYGTLTVGGDVSIGGSLTIPSNKSIVVDKLESGSIVINSMTNGSVIISNKTGGTAQINGVIIKDSGGSQPTTITIPRGNKASSMVSGVWYYVPTQSITYGTHNFTVPETVIKGGSTYDNIIYTPSSQYSMEYRLVVKDNKIQIAYHVVAPSTDQTTYHELVNYYTTDIKFA